MSEFFNLYIYQPIFYIFKFIYHFLAFNDFGLAIIILTIFIRAILLPVFYKNTKNQMILFKIKPEIEKIQKEYKTDKQKQNLLLIELYKKNKINPFFGFLFFLIQIPILIALYKLFFTEISATSFDNLYFLSLINLKEKSIFLAFLAALTQYYQTKIMIDFQKRFIKKPDKEKEIIKKDNDLNLDFKNIFNDSFNKSLLYFSPFLTFLILLNLPSGLGLYWSVSNIFSIGQQYWLNKKIN